MDPYLEKCGKLHDEVHSDDDDLKENYADKEEESCEIIVHEATTEQKREADNNETTSNQIMRCFNSFIYLKERKSCSYCLLTAYGTYSS